MRRTRTEGGFTLVETVIAIAIIALVVAVSVPVVSSISRAELRMASGRVSALLRTTYEQAALSGGTTRLVIDLQKGTLVPEAQEKISFLALGDEAEEHKFAAPDKKADKDTQAEDDNATLSEQDLAGSLGELATLAKAFGFAGEGVGGGSAGPAPFAATGEGYTLPEGLSITGFWAKHLREELREGQGYLYFFPLGHTEHAIIFLAEEGGSVYSIEVAPLSGKVTVHDERIEVPSR